MKKINKINITTAKARRIAYEAADKADFVTAAFYYRVAIENYNQDIQVSEMYRIDYKYLLRHTDHG